VAKNKVEHLVINPPNFQTAVFHIRGTTPYMQCRFSRKAEEEIIATQEAGHTAKKGKKREAKDFEQCYKDSMYIDGKDGWHGIPSDSFRNAGISACRVCGYQMTRAKLTIFIEADGYDYLKPQRGLTRITKGKPEMDLSYVRLPKGPVDMRARALFRTGWEAKPVVRWDADQFKLSDVANLISRVGQQVGIGEGRPDSKDSAGMGLGLFKIVGTKES
jgi:hypothetical protein